MKVLYVSGKYTDERGEWFVQRNIMEAMEAAGRIWGINGLCAICPHGNTAMMGGLASYDKFIQGDLELIERVDGIVMLANWHDSKGARLELEHATIHGIPVYYLPVDWPKLHQLGLTETDRVRFKGLEENINAGSVLKRDACCAAHSACYIPFSAVRITSDLGHSSGGS